MLLGQAEDKAEVDMDTDAPQVSHKPGGEPKIKVSISHGVRFASKSNRRFSPLKSTNEKATLPWRNLTDTTPPSVLFVPTPPRLVLIMRKGQTSLTEHLTSALPKCQDRERKTRRNRDVTGWKGLRHRE